MNQVLKMKTPPKTEEELNDMATRIGVAIASKMLPAEELNLPEKLEERRKFYNIPNEAFELRAAYDRVLLWQVDPRHMEKKVREHGPEAAKKFGGGLIWMPETSQRMARDETPRGVVVTAGLRALDDLRSNGMDVGHVVNFVRLAPWRIPIGDYDGHQVHLLVLRSGDIIASEDIVEDMKEGRTSLGLNEQTQHVFKNASGPNFPPREGFVSEDY